MEATLSRIEGKLDTKVSYDAFNPVLRRVEMLESGETPLGKVLLGQFTAFQQQVNELTLHGSGNAREALKEVAVLEERINRVETANIKSASAMSERRDRSDRFYRTWGLGLTLLSVTSTVIAVFTSLAVPH